MNYLCELLVYFDQHNILNSMKSACEDFLNSLTEKSMQQYPPMRYVLKVDTIKIFDEHADLGHLLLHEPRKFQKLSSDILYACLKALYIDDPHIEVMPAQIYLIVRATTTPNHKIINSGHYYGGLMSYIGILLTKSKPSTYAYHSVWSCPEECGTVLLQNLPKSSPKCYVCKSVLFEHCSYRRSGEQVFATFKIDGKCNPIIFPIKDDLIHKLRVGLRYSIVFDAFMKTFCVWSLEEETILAAPTTQPMPKDIKILYDQCKEVPWKFIYCLASGLGLQSCPVNSLIKLKINILLSLTSVKANAVIDSPIVHVLATGLDSSLVSNLMIETANLADRCVTVSPTSNTQISTALIASSGGVCAMPLPIQIYSQKQTSTILSAIEKNEIVTDDGASKDTIKLRSAVWAQGNDVHKLNMFKVASVFGSVCRGDFDEDSDEIVNFILENSTDPPKTSKEELKAIKDLKTYIDIVAGLNVILEEDAEALLRNYFLGARKKWPEGVLVSTMSALIALTMTSARLCRRSKTTKEDAIFAIWLHVSGNPGPRFAPDEYLETPSDVRKLHKMIHNFIKWLEEYVVSV